MKSAGFWRPFALTTSFENQPVHRRETPDVAECAIQGSYTHNSPVCTYVRTYGAHCEVRKEWDLGQAVKTFQTVSGLLPALHSSDSGSGRGGSVSPSWLHATSTSSSHHCCSSQYQLGQPATGPGPPSFPATDGFYATVKAEPRQKNKR